MGKINIGLVGYGYWGPNLARNFNANSRCTLRCIAEQAPRRREIAQGMFPGVEIASDASDMLESPDIDVVALATPVFSHFDLARRALEQGKHVWVEKPMTTTSAEAEQLVELAARKNKIIMVDHTFIFTSAVRKIRELVESGALGNLLYYDSVRVNLGLLQSDVNVVWDLAPHDLSIMDYVLRKQPKAVSAHGACHFGQNIEEMAYVTLYYEDNFIAHLHVNWLSPVKIRHTLIGGDKKMVVWNDLDNENKIMIYDKGVEVMKRDDSYFALAQYRIGDMSSPALANREALSAEVDYFLDCIERGEEPVNNGEAGLKVVRILESAEESIKQNGALVKIRG